MKTPPDWLDRAIREGLGRMMLLNFNGRPAEDFAAEVFDQWIDDLFPCRDWSEVDAPRIAEAFRRMRVSRTEWPRPDEFLRMLSTVDKPKPRTKALPAPVSPGQSEVADRVFAEMAEFCATFGRPKPSESTPEGEANV